MSDKRILVIDDDEVLRYSFSKALSRLGFTCLEADSLASTQAVCGAHQIDWVILDLRLGQESGLELAQWLLTHDQGIEIIIITGYAAVSTAVEAIKIGVKDYLIKPVSVEEVIKAFNREGVTVTQTIQTEPLSTKRLEWEHIQKVLMAHNGNISQAAKALKMHRRTLQRKLQKKPVKE